MGNKRRLEWVDFSYLPISASNILIFEISVNSFFEKTDIFHKKVAFLQLSSYFIGLNRFNCYKTG